ncbi:MAG: ATP-dependent DNA helicase RecG [Chloroflexota bacterium]
MPLNAEPLWRVLELEKKKGYQNQAVFGGLDKFLRNWSATAVESITLPRYLFRFRELRLDAPGYVSMTAEERKVWIDNVLAFLSLLESPKSYISAKAALSRSPKVKSVKSKPSVDSGIKLDSPITVVKGIGMALTPRFNRLGVKTVRDLIYFFPHRHLNYSERRHISELTEGREETVIANVWEAGVKFIGGRRSTEAIVGDETGNVRVVWFNNPYIAKRLTTNSRIVLSGRVGNFQGRPVFQSPEWELLSEEEDKELTHAGRLVPVYHLTEGLHPRQVRRLMKDVVTRWAPNVKDFLPRDIVDRDKLLNISDAILQAHFPDSEELKDRARERLAFDELFLLQLGVMTRKRTYQERQPAKPIAVRAEMLTAFVKSLSFKLTSAQGKVLKEILADLGRPIPMSRLLQGDVGSGKTVVATAALLTAVTNGMQGAFMAPTEILAEQHFKTVCTMLVTMGKETGDAEGYIRTYQAFPTRKVTVALLIGAESASKKETVQKGVADGTVDIVIGTHALIQKEVSFKDLTLAVIDEQHRFGVAQRQMLRQKGFSPHILVMTATPIPRTLALTLYGDLDLSVIDEMPPGRLEIKTRWLRPVQRQAGYEWIKREVKAGHQAFIICPLIEESEAIEAKAATTEYERLAGEVFPGLKLGLIHGRMTAQEKEYAMRHFHSGNFDILVATPVVEVGIDVPNATVMMVESASRFGLSQLHQFRGRVGRGSAQSYCMLLSDEASEIGRERLDIIERTQDGFVLAEEDLKLRGPGEFFGTRQSGLPDLKMAKLSDIRLLELARSEATRIFEKDPELNEKDYEALAEELRRVFPDIYEVS